MEPNERCRQGEDAWREAERAAKAQAVAGGPVPAVAQLVRCALALARDRRRTADLPAEILVALAASRLWKPAQALARARSLGSHGERARALAGLAPYLPGTERDAVYAEAVDAAGRDGLAPEAVAEMVSLLPAPHRERALAMGLERARRRRANHGTKGFLRDTAALLPESLLPAALDLVRAFTDDYATPGALAPLAPHLPPRLLPEALTIAEAGAADHRRAEALCALAPHLLEPLARQALVAAGGIEGRNSRNRALAALYARLRERLRPDALAETWAVVRAIDNEFVPVAYTHLTRPTN